MIFGSIGRREHRSKPRSQRSVWQRERMGRRKLSALPMQHREPRFTTPPMEPYHRIPLRFIAALFPWPHPKPFKRSRAQPVMCPAASHQRNIRLRLPQRRPPSICQGGWTHTAVTVNLSDSTPGATIYYTTDGSAPSAKSMQYSTSLTVSTTTILNAIAFAPGFASSSVAKSIYVISQPDNFANEWVWRSGSSTFPVSFLLTGRRIWHAARASCKQCTWWERGTG